VTNVSRVEHRKTPALSLAAVPLALLFLLLIAVVFSAMGTTIGSSMQDMQAFQFTLTCEKAKS